MRVIYLLYQLLIALPLLLLASVLTALSTAVGCMFGNGHFWGYYPAALWGWLFIRVLLLPVKVEGREHLEAGQSYVFVANHQGAFDIFLIYGFLRRSFRWMMKRQLVSIPLVGWACKKSHQVLVDKRSTSAVKATYKAARSILSGGTSLTVFPEGARTFTGHMGQFKKGAFALADELQLPVVPLTINGSFDVLPRMRKVPFVTWHRLSLTIHQPIYPVGVGSDNVQATMRQAYQSVMSGLEERYQGFVENPDQ